MDTLTTCKTLLLFFSFCLVQASVIPENNSEEIEKMLGGDIFLRANPNNFNHGQNIIAQPFGAQYGLVRKPRASVDQDSDQSSIQPYVVSTALNAGAMTDFQQNFPLLNRIYDLGFLF